MEGCGQKQEFSLKFQGYGCGPHQGNLGNEGCEPGPVIWGHHLRLVTVIDGCKEGGN